MTRAREERTPSPIPVTSAAVLAGLAVVALIIGSVADLPLAEAVYRPDNTFGKVFAAYGESPALLALVAAGTLAILARPPVHTLLRWLLVLGGAALIIVGTLALIIRPEEYWALPVVARTLIALALALATAWGVARASAGARWQAMCVLAAALFAVVAVELVTVQGIKALWERPRMRMLTETGADFAPWWSPGYAGKEALLATGVDSSDFKSFPSGHSAHAAVALVLTGFALLREDIARSATWLFSAGALWALVVAFSRLTLGAHFLSDTAVGLLVTLAAVTIICALSARILDAGILDRLRIAGPGAGPRHGRMTQ